MGPRNHDANVTSDPRNRIWNELGGSYAEGEGEMNGGIDDGERGSEHGPLFDHQVSADRYSSLMDKVATMKVDEKRIFNFLNMCKTKLKEAETNPIR